MPFGILFPLQGKESSSGLPPPVLIAPLTIYRSTTVLGRRTSAKYILLQVFTFITSHNGAYRHSQCMTRKGGVYDPCNRSPLCIQPTFFEKRRMTEAVTRLPRKNTTASKKPATENDASNTKPGEMTTAPKKRNRNSNASKENIAQIDRHEPQLSVHQAPQLAGRVLVASSPPSSSPPSAPFMRRSSPYPFPRFSDDRASHRSKRARYSAYPDLHEQHHTHASRVTSYQPSVFRGESV